MSKINAQDLKKVWFRSHILQGATSFDRGQSLGYCIAMMPIIRKLYPEKEKQAAALRRHLEFFNTTPQVATFIMGLTIAQEEECAANGDDFDPSSINAIKSSLMGPFAGIGDSFFWGTFRILAAGVGISLAQQGSVLGPILMAVLFIVPAWLTRWFGLQIGYKSGKSFMEKAYTGGLMDKVTYGASVVGLTVVGAMVATMVKLQTTLVVNMGAVSLNLQESVFDSIMPQILPLGLTFLVFWLLRKKVNINLIMLGMIVVAILGRLLNIL